MTGATGQIGSQVARALVARGDRVSCLVRDRERLKVLEPAGLDLIEGDVTEPHSLDLRGHDAVVHCAGVVSYRASELDWQRSVNVGGTQNVLDAAARAGCKRLLLTSSIAALGWVEGDALGDERTPFNWGGQGLGYQETKREAQERVLAEDRLEALAVNPGIVFGSHDINRNGGRILFMLRAGQPGAPSGRTTAVTLDDVVRGHLAALDRGRAGESYVLAGFTGSFVELYAEVGQVIGVLPPTRVLPDSLVLAGGWLQQLKATLTGGEPSLTPALARVSCRNRTYSAAKAERELGFRASPLRDGIRACLEWYRERGLIE